LSQILQFLRFILCLFIGWGLLSPTAVQGQKRKPKGVFLTDTIETGKPFSYSFSFLHDPVQEVFFPDSSFSFSPFEVIDQEFFTTRTDSSGSLDSTVYRIISFDVSPTQTLSLPVYVLADGDCTVAYAEVDTVFLRLLLPVSARLDTLSLQADTRVELLLRQFDYPVFVAVLLSIGLFVSLVYWLFGRGIMKQWRMFQLQRRHSDFVRNFNRLNRNAREIDSTVEAEKAVVIWKKYLERVEKKPFTTYTTREILDNIPDEALENALKEIDHIIYGQVKSNQMDASLQVLKNIAQRSYRRRRLEIARAGKSNS
jgi:hypothetical protein